MKRYNWVISKAANTMPKNTKLFVYQRLVLQGRELVVLNAHITTSGYMKTLPNLRSFKKYYNLRLTRSRKLSYSHKNPLRSTLVRNHLKIKNTCYNASIKLSKNKLNPAFNWKHISSMISF